MVVVTEICFQINRTMYRDISHPQNASDTKLLNNHQNRKGTNKRIVHSFNQLETGKIPKNKRCAFLGFSSEVRILQVFFFENVMREKKGSGFLVLSSEATRL